MRLAVSRFVLKRRCHGPQCTYIQMYTLQSQPLPKKGTLGPDENLFMSMVDSFHLFYASTNFVWFVSFSTLFGLMICTQIRLKDWPGRKQRVVANQHFIWIKSTLCKVRMKLTWDQKKCNLQERKYNSPSSLKLLKYPKYLKISKMSKTQELCLGLSMVVWV